MNQRSIVWVADISSSESVRKMVRRGMGWFGRIDVLVNNAGISLKKEGGKVPVYEIEDDQWHVIFAVNHKALFTASGKWRRRW